MVLLNKEWSGKNMVIPDNGGPPCQRCLTLGLNCMPREPKRAPKKQLVVPKPNTVAEPPHLTAQTPTLTASPKSEVRELPATLSNHIRRDDNRDDPEVAIIGYNPPPSPTPM